jgi:hypothetical protein
MKSAAAREPFAAAQTLRMDAAAIAAIKEVQSAAQKMKDNFQD